MAMSEHSQNTHTEIAIKVDRQMAATVEHCTHNNVKVVVSVSSSNELIFFIHFYSFFLYLIITTH